MNPTIWIWLSTWLHLLNIGLLSSLQMKIVPETLNGNLDEIHQIRVPFDHVIHLKRKKEKEKKVGRGREGKRAGDGNILEGDEIEAYFQLATCTLGPLRITLLGKVQDPR